MWAGQGLVGRVMAGNHGWHHWVGVIVIYDFRVGFREDAMSLVAGIACCDGGVDVGGRVGGLLGFFCAMSLF